MQLPIQRYLADLHQRYAALHDGEVASYIPELTRANPDWFGLSVVTITVMPQIGSVAIFIHPRARALVVTRLRPATVVSPLRRAEGRTP